MNLLPNDGDVTYLAGFFSPDDSRIWFAQLFSSIPWKPDEIVLYGKRITTSRKVAWFADDGHAYKYSGVIKTATAWTPELTDLKAKVEAVTRTKFNSCLLNLYHNGNEGMGWHSDDEPELGTNSVIASISFGAARKFAFRHRTTGEKIALMLDPGSLLIMKGETQKYWKHSLLKSTRILEPRINLTFRVIDPRNR